MKSKSILLLIALLYISLVLSAITTGTNGELKPSGAVDGFLSAGFESPDISGSGFVHVPQNSDWTFTGSSGMVENGGPYGNTNAPEGKQAAYIQETGEISQEIYITETKSGKIMNDLYDNFYSKELFEDLWFYRDGKPLIMGHADDSSLRTEVKDFFTIKYSWAWTDTKSKSDHWQWLDKYPQDWGWHKEPAMAEQITVSAAHHPQNPLGKSFSNEKQPAVDENYLTEFTAQGLQFQEQWDRALDVDPEIVMITQWNEWLAQRFEWNSDQTHYAGRTIKKGNVFFVDVFSAEFNRDIAPMKGGYTDNYYMQLVQNIRRFKGVRPIPQNIGFNKIEIDGDFDDWQTIKVEYRDAIGDVLHRDHSGYDDLHYIDTSGRNDISTSKVAVSKKNVSFYVETNQDVTSHLDENWMLLLIDADNNSETGWFGYDFLVNKEVVDKENTVLMRYNEERATWINQNTVKYSYSNNKIELNITRKQLGLEGDQLTFDFKWSDNPAGLNDPISFCTGGDTAPNRRFNYRCIWKK